MGQRVKLSHYKNCDVNEGIDSIQVMDVCNAPHCQYTKLKDFIISPFV